MATAGENGRQNEEREEYGKEDNGNRIKKKHDNGRQDNGNRKH